MDQQTSQMAGTEDDKIFGMTKAKWQEFQFLAGQLGVIDNKAKSILQINAILIAITSIASFLGTDFDYNIKVLSAIAAAFVLISTAVCTKTVWIKWSTGQNLNGQPSITNLIMVRNEKTRWLHMSLVLLLIALVFFLLLIVYKTFS